MRIVPTNCVPENSKLARQLMNTNGQVLLKKGTPLTLALLKRIEDNQIFTIYVDDGYSDHEINDLIRPELKTKAVQTLKETFQFLEKRQAQNSKIDMDLQKKLSHRSMAKYLTQIKSVSSQIIEEISINRQLMINLVDIKNLDNYVYEHSVNVAVLSLIVGIELKMNYNELLMLFLGALLHDVGKSMLPKELITQKDALSTTQEDLLKTHPQLGYDYLKENYAFPLAVKMAILQHHERFDGKGYPRGIAGLNIHRHARIIALADCYDAMTSDKPQNRAVPPNEALEYIMGACGTHFDFDLGTIFCRKVVPYPEGSLVKLSDDSIAVVSQVNLDYPLRPKIKVLVKDTPVSELKVIDLMKDTNITILGMQYLAPQP